MSDLTSLFREKAPILYRSEKEVCFQVDDVAPCQTRLASTSARIKLAERTDRALQACSHDNTFDVVVGKELGDHAFVNAVHMAFSEHRPLVLTPDAVWMTLAQGFAQHINNHAEALRSRLVSHKGKMELKAEVQGLSQRDWTQAIEQWSGAIKRSVGEELHDLMICDFTTTTPTIRTASQVVMMDTFQRYFDYLLTCICGIPSITLRGSVQDWTRIRGRIDAMEGYHLGWWTDRLKPLCDAFIETANGAPSRGFWQHIYKPKAAYGGEVITGWLADMFPYVKHPVTRALTIRNPILETPRHELCVEHGLAPYRLPTGLSGATVVLTTLHDAEVRELGLIAGFLGVVEDADTCSLEPEIGWAVVEGDDVSRLLEKLRPTHAQSDSPGKRAFTVGSVGLNGVPKELMQILDQAGADAVFFADTDHPWRVTTVQQFSIQAGAEKGSDRTVTAFMELGDGRHLAYLPMSRPKEWLPEWWIVVGRLQTDRLFAVEAVIAKGILQLLERINTRQGQYYFDDPDFVPDGSLQR